MPYYKYLIDATKTFVPEVDRDAYTHLVTELHAKFKKIEEAGDNFGARPPSGHTHVRYNEDFSRLWLEFTDPQGQDTFWEWAVLMKQAPFIKNMMNDARATVDKYKNFDFNTRAKYEELERVRVSLGFP